MAKLYIPIENLEVESTIQIGELIIHSSRDLQSIVETVNKITYKTKNTDEQKDHWARWYENDLKQQFSHHAFIEMETKATNEGRLIPKDRSLIYEKVKQVLAVLYLLQKEIADKYNIENQVFGLKRELYKSLNYVVALEGEDRSTSSYDHEGAISDWKFVEKEISKFQNNITFNYFDELLKRTDRSEIEIRILSSIAWLHDAVLDFTPINRFVKLFISLEVLFASGKRQKSFRLARFSTLLSHLYFLDNWKCLCPILESHTAKEYEDNIKKLNLPGMCSAYWKLREWYEIRNSIVHDAARSIDKKALSSFEWWSQKLITSTIEVIAKEKIGTLDELEVFLEREYSEKRKSFVEKLENSN
jgi:hypothetical protein